MDVNQARKDLELKLAQRGIIGDAVDAEIEKIVAAIPALLRPTFDADDVVAASQYVDKYYAALDGGQNPVPQPVNQPKVGGTPEVSIPAAELKAIQEFQNNTRADRTDRAQKTKIVKLIGDKPYPGTYLSKGTKMIPHADEAKFVKYREVLVDTPENVQAYETCLAAIKNKTPMDIYIPDESKWSPKCIGAEIDTPAASGSGNERKTFDNTGLLAYVAYDLIGCIPCDANSIGAKLGTVRAKRDKASASQSALTPRLILVNRKDAFKDANKHVFASQPKKNNDKVITKAGTVRSKLSFQIYTGDTNKMGEKKTRTVRVSGRANVPKWERTSAVYEDLFGAAEKQSNVVSIPSGKERAAMDAIINKTLYAISENASVFGDASYEIEKALAGANKSQSDKTDFE